MKKLSFWILGLFGEGFANRRFSRKKLFTQVFVQKILGLNRHVPWPVHWTSTVKGVENIDRGSRCPGLSKGCHIDGRNGLTIGENTWMGPGVKIVSMNHDLCDYMSYPETDPIVIGRDCWLASNAVVLAGVCLGDHTVVAAGSVVTKSFPDGDQLLAGVPARVIRKLDEYRG